VGHIPLASYETSPLPSHVGQSDPQQATAVPLAKQVPFGHVEPVGDEYPLDSQYPASEPPLDAPVDEHATTRSTARADPGP
jgi:hypothetical protein